MKNDFIEKLNEAATNINARAITVSQTREHLHLKATDRHTLLRALHVELRNVTLWFGVPDPAGENQCQYRDTDNLSH